MKLTAPIDITVLRVTTLNAILAKAATVPKVKVVYIFVKEIFYVDVYSLVTITKIHSYIQKI